MRMRRLVVALACLSAVGCSEDPVDLEGVEEVGTAESGASAAGSTYLATVDKDDDVTPMCDQQTGAAVGVDRVRTPGAWSFDFVVGVTSEQEVFLAPCSAL